MVEGTPLLRAHTGNGIEGSNPFVSATCPPETVLPIQLRPNFSVVFEGYRVWAKHYFSAKTPEVALCRAVFSEADDCAVLVQSL